MLDEGLDYGSVNEKNGPWETRKRTLVYQDHWAIVRKEDVIHPDGFTPGSFSVIGLNDGVATLALDNKKNAFLIKEHRYAVRQEGLEVANGGIDRGEIPIIAAKRELQEELGITAGRWKYYGEVFVHPSNIESVQHLFLARDLTLGDQQLEVSEKIERIVIPFDEVIDRTLSGDIKHAPSVAVIMKVAYDLANSKIDYRPN